MRSDMNQIKFKSTKCLEIVALMNESLCIALQTVSHGGK